MSGLRRMIERLRRETLAAPSGSFREAAARRPALAAHADLGSVLTALADETEESYPAREALTRAMLEEQREGGVSLWGSALLLAYYPMLSRLRRRLVTTTVTSDELDQVVVAAFLAAVGEVPLHLDRLPMRLRQRTERQVFAYLRKEREEYYPRGDAGELDAMSAEYRQGLSPQRHDDTLLDLSLLLERAVAQGVPPRSLEVVEATVLHRELLRSYVERVGPEDEVERERTYQRLKRQRSRTLKRLRALLRVSPMQEAAGF
jgi:hypothetical protein